jgi:iron(III) transport system permease protein
MSRRWSVVAYGVILVFLGVFFLYPLFRTVRGGFFDEGGNFTFAFLGEVFRNPIYAEGLWNSFLLALATMALVILISLPLAVLNVRYRFPGKSLLGALVLVPMILPPFVGAIGFRRFWGQAGMFNSFLEILGLAPEQPIDWLGWSRFWGVAIAIALHLYPILYLNASAALANLDPTLEEAARNLGAGRWRRFRRITLPLMMPGLFAGGTIVFIWAFTELGTPLMFDYNRVASVQIFHAIREIGDNPFPYVLVVVLLSSSLLLYVLGKVALGRQRGGAMLSRAIIAARETPLHGWRAALAVGTFLLVAGLSLIPHAGVVLMSLSHDWYATVIPHQWTLVHYQDALGHAMTVPSIGNSLRYAGLATCVDVIIGLFAAWIIVRTTLRGRGVLDALVMAPLAVPGLVLAFGYLAMTQPGEWFHALDPSEDPTILLVIAYAIRRLPTLSVPSRRVSNRPASLSKKRLETSAADLCALSGGLRFR